MRILVSDRTGEVSERLKAHLESRLQELGRHFSLLAEADVELDRDVRRSERPLQVVDVTLRMLAPRVQPIRVREAGRELLAVIDLVVDELDREVLRLKERLRDHPQRIGPV